MTMTANTHETDAEFLRRLANEMLQFSGFTAGLAATSRQPYPMEMLRDTKVEADRMRAIASRLEKP